MTMSQAKPLSFPGGTHKPATPTRDELVRNAGEWMELAIGEQMNGSEAVINDDIEKAIRDLRNAEHKLALARVALTEAVNAPRRSP